MLERDLQANRMPIIMVIFKLCPVKFFHSILRKKMKSLTLNIPQDRLKTTLCHNIM